MGKRILGHIGELHAEGKLLDVLSIIKKQPGTKLFIDASDMDEPYQILKYDNSKITYQPANDVIPNSLYLDYFLTARKYFISTAGNIVSMFEDEQ